MRASATPASPPRDAPPRVPAFGSAERIEGSLSEMLRGMRGSEILRIAAEIRRLVATGRPVCNLTVGDFDPRQFPIPRGLLEGIHEALRSGETNYPPANGLLALREAVAARTARDLGVHYPTESTLIASGVRPLIFAAFHAVLDPGDPVLYGVPSWNVDHYGYLTGARGIPVVTRREHEFHPTLEDLAPHLSSAKLLCLCSPANPTGTMIAPAELTRITVAVVEENRRRERIGGPVLFLLYDQVYGSIVHGATAHASPVALVPEAAPWTILLDGISKAFAGTGLRVGWSLAPPVLIAKMSDFLGHVGAWAPRAEQVATARFLHDHAAIAAFREVMDRGLRERLDALCDGFARLRHAGHPVDFVRPEGAMYLSLQLDLVGRTIAGRAIRSNEEIRELLLEAAGVAAVPFQAFGLPEETGWFRLSVGAVSVDEIEQGIWRVGELITNS